MLAKYQYSVVLIGINPVENVVREQVVVYNMTVLKHFVPHGTYLYKFWPQNVSIRQEAKCFKTPILYTTDTHF